MGGIKYYQLAKGEELPDEFCAVMDINGEPSEYTFYVPEAENAKLRKLALDFYDAIDSVFWDGVAETKERFKPRMREVGVEVK